MKCVACDNDIDWHKRQINRIENEVGPMAAMDFDTQHYGIDDDDVCDDCGMPDGEHLIDIEH